MNKIVILIIFVLCFSFISADVLIDMNNACGNDKLNAMDQGGVVSYWNAKNYCIEYGDDYIKKLDNIYTWTAWVDSNSYDDDGLECDLTGTQWYFNSLDCFDGAVTEGNEVIYLSSTNNAHASVAPDINVYTVPVYVPDYVYLSNDYTGCSSFQLYASSNSHISVDGTYNYDICLRSYGIPLECSVGGDGFCIFSVSDGGNGQVSQCGYGNGYEDVNCEMSRDVEFIRCGDKVQQVATAENRVVNYDTCNVINWSYAPYIAGNCTSEQCLNPYNGQCVEKTYNLSIEDGYSVPEYDINGDVVGTIDLPEALFDLTCSTDGTWCPRDFEWTCRMITLGVEECWCQYKPDNCWFNPELNRIGQECGISNNPINYIYELTNLWVIDFDEFKSDRACFAVEDSDDACCLDIMLDPNNRNYDYYRAQPIRIY
ncbi:hypothetical protein ACFL1H_05400 [Nanoarchaeota archaeon]